MSTSILVPVLLEEMISWENTRLLLQRKQHYLTTLMAIESIKCALGCLFFVFCSYLSENFLSSDGIKKLSDARLAKTFQSCRISECPENNSGMGKKCSHRCLLKMFK